MSETMKELLIKQRENTVNKVLGYALLVVAVLALAAAIFVNPFFIIAMILSGVFSFIIYFRRMSVEYEYTYLDEYGREDFVNGEFTVLDNPDYIGGAARVCLKTLAYLNPFAQMEYAKTAIKEVIGFDNDYYYNHKNKVPYMYELYFPLVTLGLMTALTLGGCVFFRKKDLF